MFPISSEFKIKNNAPESIPKQQTSLGINLAFDYETGSFVLENGCPADNKTEIAKVKQWLELALRTVPGKYAIYDNTFGVYTAGIVGMRNVSFGFMTSELQREIKEVCRKCPIIQSAANFEFKRNDGGLNVSFRVVLNNGEAEEVSVNVKNS